MSTKPKTLQQAIIHFSNPDNCLEFMVQSALAEWRDLPHLWTQGCCVPRESAQVAMQERP